MERLQKWFGGTYARKNKDGENTISSTLPQAQVAPPIASANPGPFAEQPQPSSVLEIEAGANVTETRVGQLIEQGRALILRVVPLKEGDCLSCKLIATGTLWGAALFVIVTYRKARLRYTGFKRKLFAAQIASFVTFVTLMGTARFFDLSVFEEMEKKSEDKKSLGQLIKGDLENMKMFMSKLSSSDKSDT